jgi:uncharacterized protein YacL
MNVSLLFIRLFFVILSVLFMTAYTVNAEGKPTPDAISLGVLLGLVIGGLLILLDKIFRRFNLRTFNIAIIGLLFGYLMGEALLLVFQGMMQLASFSKEGPVLEIVKMFLYLFGTYLGLVMTLRAADELYISVPFVRFSPTRLKKRDILIDASLLQDGRILDLAGSRLLDHYLVLPRFVVKDLFAQSESQDEGIRQKARRSLDTIKKLEASQFLGLRYNDTDFPDVKDQAGKLVRLARLLDASILSADTSRLQTSTAETVPIISIHTLSNALKPITQTGEFLKVKIQRYGKEARQGVGYLEDGTMVVVNGGGDYLGETIEVRVLSVKHTASGRMIFCNADDQGMPSDEEESDDDYDEE